MDNRTNLAKLLAKNLKQVEDKVLQSRTQYNRVMMTSMAASGASTLIAGATSAIGEAAKIGTEGWRLACIVAAVFGFISTISSMLIHQKNLNEKVSEGKECLSRLKYLDTVMSTGSKQLTEITQEFEELVVKYPEIIG